MKTVSQYIESGVLYIHLCLERKSLSTAKNADYSIPGEAENVTDRTHNCEIFAREGKTFKRVLRDLVY